MLKNADRLNKTSQILQPGGCGQVFTLWSNSDIQRSILLYLDAVVKLAPNLELIIPGKLFFDQLNFRLFWTSRTEFCVFKCRNTLPSVSLLLVLKFADRICLNIEKRAVYCLIYKMEQVIKSLPNWSLQWVSTRNIVCKDGHKTTPEAKKREGTTP